MGLLSVIERVPNYARRHGLRATLGRAWIACKRSLTGGGMVLFSCELDSSKCPAVGDLAPGRIESKRSEAELDARDRQQIMGAWNPVMARKLMDERFGRGAWLWLYKIEGDVAAYGWTLVGGSMEPHYVTFISGDVHLFDFFVMPKFRGRGINPRLVRQILAEFAGEKRGRAYIEAAEWNAAQLSSLRKTPFQKLGIARKRHPFGKPVVVWTK